MNILKSLAVKNVEEATRDIPVIDFSPAFSGPPGGLEAVARQVKRASESVGFFYLAGHGVPDAVVDAAFAASRELHALPEPEKLRLKLNENNIGYLPVNQSIQGASTVPQGHPPQLQRELLHQPRSRRRSSRRGGRARRCAAATSGPRGTSACGPRW